MRKGVWSQCGTQCRVCQLTMRAMSGHSELVNAIEGNLPGRSQGLKWPENCSNMSKVFSSLHSRQTCVRVRERILMADGGLSKPGGRQQLIPSNSDCFPMVRRSGGSGSDETILIREGEQEQEQPALDDNPLCWWSRLVWRQTDDWPRTSLPFATT